MSDQINTSDVTALILAGGKASRFNGKDKGLLLFKQRPMITHVIDALQPQVHTIVISANRNIDQYQPFGYPVLQDEQTDMQQLQGPLAGILQGLRQCTTPWLLLSPCDTPFIAPDYCQQMRQAATPDTLVVASSQGKLQPLFALIPVAFAPALASALEQRIYKVGQWLGSMPHHTLDFGTTSMFTNINTPAELARAEQYFNC